MQPDVQAHRCISIARMQESGTKLPVCSLWVCGHITVLVEKAPLVVSADVLHRAGAGRVAHKGPVPICPQGPFLIFGCPVAGEAVGSLLMRVVV